MDRFFFGKLRILRWAVVLALPLPSLSGQTPVLVTIDVAGTRKPVSTYIFGRNNSLSDDPSSPVQSATWTRYRDAGVTMFREGGGNNSTKYNWRKKLSSHPDWYNNVYSHDWDYAALSLQQNIPAAQGQYTLSLIGKAAANKSNNFYDWGYNGSQPWSGVTQNLAGGGEVNPAGGGKALTEGNPDKYLEPWSADSVAGILKKWFGEGGLGLDKQKFNYWNLNNEPEIWSGTHDDVMPTQLPAEEFMQRYFETAKKARLLFPEIKLMGPVPANEWQWYNWNNGAISYGGKSYVWLEYFIRRIADEQKATGIRLLDVLDIHFYPGETDAAQILQLHRVFFDRNYVYPGANGVHRIGGGWNTSINKEYIFERCREWLDQYMGTGHGVTFSVSETSVSGSAPVMVNALWYASMLGEFARKGVEAFTPWDWRVGMWEVVHLYTRYNHAYYLSSVSSAEETVSAYPTINGNGDSLTVVLLNRSLAQSQEVNVQLQNFIPAGTTLATKQLKNLSSTETFFSRNNNALLSGNIQARANGFTITLPPLSVTSVLVPGGPTAAGDPVNGNEGTPEIKAWPNPTVSECTLAWSFIPSHQGVVEVRDVAGRLMINWDLNQTDVLRGSLSMSVEGWPAGIYMVRMTSGNFSGFTRILVIPEHR